MSDLHDKPDYWRARADVARAAARMLQNLDFKREMLAIAKGASTERLRLPTRQRRPRYKV
jgi:hypothetical protein